jgi:transposase-like protein
MTTLSETNQTEANLILKSDALGRVRTSPERKEALLAEYQRSGMTAAAFSRWCGIKYSTFAAWVGKARRGRPGGGCAEAGPDPCIKPMHWAELVCRDAEGERRSPLVIHLNGTVRVEAGDAQMAASLLEAMGVRVC